MNMDVKFDKQKLSKIWKYGGNWIIFILLWVISAAIIGAMEASKQNIELITVEREVSELKLMIDHLTLTKSQMGEDDEENRRQVDKLVNLFEEEDFPRIWEMGQHDFQDHLSVVKVQLDLFHEEFSEVLKNLNKTDVEGLRLTRQLLTLFSDPRTAVLMERLGQLRNQDQGPQVIISGPPPEEWGFGDSLHYVSSVFTTLGYGAKFPVTAGGKAFTVLMVFILLPLFIHCLTSAATLINKGIDRVFGIAENYDDLESLTETATSKNPENLRLRKQAMFKGVLVLGAALTVHLLISAIYHFIVTGWTFGDVLYYEVLNYSTVGFGDMIPEDELTVAGAIFKNILVKIPAAILLLATYLRLLPVLS